MATTAPDSDVIIKSGEFNEYVDACAQIQRLEQELILAQNIVDLEAGFLPFDKVILIIRTLLHLNLILLFECI